MRASAVVRVFAALVLLPCWVDAAQACTCSGPQPICSIHLGTTPIFLGIVIERTLERPPLETVKNLDGTTSQIMHPGSYKVRLAVSETFSGKPAQERVVYTAEQSSACGFPFQVGVEYLVFTYDNKTDGQLWTSHCSKTHAVTNPNGDTDILWMRGLATAPLGVTVYGSVLLARSGPIKGATVSLRGEVNRDIVPDEQGHYEAKGIPAGDYTISAVLPAGMIAGPERTLKISDKECAQMDWYATYDGHVRGQVKDANGIPVPRLGIELLSREGGTTGVTRITYFASTGEDGRSDFKFVSPGDYIVVANKYGSTPDVPYPKRYYPAAETENEARTVHLGASAAVDEVDVTMPNALKKVAVKVRVVDGDGRPAANVTVYGYHDRSSIMPMSAMTDTDGMASLPVYDGQFYSLTALQQGGTQQRCGGPITFTAKDGLNVGTVRIEHPWGNCFYHPN